MNCRDVVDIMYEYLDREVDQSLEQDVRAHLEACDHCHALARFEETWMRFLEARARTAGAPPALRRRILEQLLGDLGTDRP
jgi:anti-sigma factor (TIGR02949 family)